MQKWQNNVQQYRDIRKSLDRSPKFSKPQIRQAKNILDLNLLCIIVRFSQVYLNV